MNQTSLGPVVAQFKPKLANVVAGSIIGLLLIVGGITATVFVVQRPERRALDTGDVVAKYAIATLAGVVAPLGGIALLAWMKRLSGHRVTVHERAFTYGSADTADVCDWDEISEIQEVFTHEQLKVLKVPGAVIKNIDRSFVVIRKDGRKFAFNVNSIDDIPKLGKILDAMRERYQLPWNTIEHR